MTCPNSTSDCPPIYPDADIAGYGVLVAFMFSTIVTFVASTYAASFYGDLELDFLYLPLMRRWTPEKKEFWCRVLDRLILGFSDQQLITGFAMILIGLAKVRTIHLYHFSLILCLAMLSCSIHMTSVLTLRRYFQDHPEVAKVRIVIMLIFALLLSGGLLYSKGPMFGASQINKIKCPVECSWSQDLSTPLISIFFICLLWLCYTAAIAYIFPNAEVFLMNAEVFLTKWLYTEPLEFLERLIPHRGLRENVMRFRPKSTKLFLPHVLQFLWALISIFLTISIRLHGSKYVAGSEARLGFGQLLSLLLILIPALGAFEVYCEEKQRHRSRARISANSQPQTTRNAGQGAPLQPPSTTAPALSSPSDPSPSR